MALLFMVGWPGCELSVLAEQDSIVPELVLESVKNDAGLTARDEEGSCYFADSLSVSFLVAEPDQEEACPQMLLKRSNGTETTAMDVSPGTFTDTLTEEGVYTYFIEDETGNVSTDSVEITAVKAENMPSISISYPDTAVSSEHMTYFREEPDLNGHAEDGLGIARIEYARAGGEFETLKDFVEEDGSYIPGNCAYEGSLKLDPLTEELTAAADGVYQYTFKVVNIVGKEAEADAVFTVDQTEPDSQVFISYKTDGDNPDQPNNMGIVDFVGNQLKKVFGKERISFDLYVKDGTPPNGDITEASGIDIKDLLEQIMLENGELTSVQEAQDGLAAFEAGGVTYSGYTHITGEITSDGSGRKDRLKIGRLADNAGNVLGGMEPGDITGTTVMYLDNVSPVLEADYGGGIAGNDGRIYYRSTAQIKLFLKENAYGEQLDGDGSPVQPEIVFAGDGKDACTATAWSVSDGEERMLESAIALPWEKGREMEYEFSIQYQDGSGNCLTAGETAKGSTDGDIFTNYRVVVDDKAPKLLSFHMDGDMGGTAGGIPVYKNRTDGGDVRISFAIEDNAAYWDAGNVLLKVINKDRQETVAEVEGNHLDWSDHGDIHEAVFEFDGEDKDGNRITENAYQIQIFYADRAQNPMEDGREPALEETVQGEISEDGLFTSGTFILDHVPPKVNIFYNSAYQTVGETGKTEGKNVPPSEGCTAYYGRKNSDGTDNGKITVTVQIEEHYLTFDKDGDIENFDFLLSKSGSPEMRKIRPDEWKMEGEVCTGSYIIEEDGDYIISVSYCDMAGNRMEKKDRVDGGEITEAGYTSPTLILDTAAPVLTRSYTAEPVDRYGERSYYNQPVHLRIKVEDQNIRCWELLDELRGMTAVDAEGTDLTEDTEAWRNISGMDGTRIVRGCWEPELRLVTEANYTVPVAFTDLAGNTAVFRAWDQVTVDTTAPEDVQFDYEVAEPVNYGPFGWLFSRGKMKITAWAKDGTAGLRMISFTVTDEHGRETVRTGTFALSAEGTCSVELPLRNADFKGTVKTEVYDYAGNCAERIRSHVVESAEKHSGTAMARITTSTPPGRSVGGEDFYNTDVTFNLTIEDSYSGLRKYSYAGGNTLSGSRNYGKEADAGLNGEAAQDITYKFSRDMTLEAALNNENDVRVWAEFEDNAGHTGRVEKLYHIDVTAPVITVEWDLDEPEDGHYFRQARTATVTVRERNFHADDVEFSITNTDGAMPVFSGWSSTGSGDDTEHVCEVTFEQDGDYTFTLSFQDMAGNEAVYDRVDSFTIDRTPPEITVKWDNQDSRNGNYYAADRTAVIDILEHNFEASLMDVLVTVDGEPVSTVSGWSRNGDHNLATVLFHTDGEYRFRVEGMDLAGNLLDGYEQEPFMIDQTPPDLEIFGIVHESANNGPVMPGIRCFDDNYDPNSMVVALSGYRSGQAEGDNIRKTVENGVEIVWNDFAYTQETDDMYLMEASVSDLAGNKSEAAVRFSVNRFGSVYTFDDWTNALAGDHGEYYTDRVQDLVVTETNVDTLEHREAVLAWNGTLSVLTEGEDYQVEESGTEASWKQYTYTFPKDNFKEEGTYTLTIYSEDRASNVSDNNSKGKKIEFAVDRTKPSILISGVEDGGRYKMNSRPVTLDVQDNLRLKEVEVQIDGNRTVYTEKEIEEAEGRLTLTVGSAGRWQEMCVTARDAAGNEESAGPVRFLVTSNILYQLFWNPSLLCGALAVPVILSTGAWCLYKKKSGKIGEN